MASSPQAAVWIASYPKSGNTWVQTVIRRAGKDLGFPRGDLDVYRLIAEGRAPEVVRGVRAEVTTAPATVLKTHSAWTAEREPHARLGLKTAGFVYVMRNPLDMLLSYINFTRQQYEKNKDSRDYQTALFTDLLGFEKIPSFEAWRETRLEDIPRASFDRALQRFTEQGTAIPGLRMAGGSWLEHCLSWRAAGQSLPSVFLRYEDLLKGPDEFQPLRKLFSFTEAQLAEAVRQVNEQQRGQQFKKVFFNKMSSYYYAQFFSAEAIGRFLARYGRELEELGYGDLPVAA